MKVCCVCTRAGHLAHECPDGEAFRRARVMPPAKEAMQTDAAKPAAFDTRLITLAIRRGDWMREHPNATADQEMAAGAAIAKELGL